MLRKSYLTFRRDSSVSIACWNAIIEPWRPLFRNSKTSLNSEKVSFKLLKKFTYLTTYFELFNFFSFLSFVCLCFVPISTRLRFGTKYWVRKLRSQCRTEKAKDLSEQGIPKSRGFNQSGDGWRTYSKRSWDL